MDSKEIKLIPEEYFTSLSSLILTYINEFNIRIINKIIEADDYVEEPKRFFYTLVNKTISSLEATNILIKDFDSKRNLQTPLNILVRSIMSDIIVAEFIINRTNSDAEKSILIDRINLDHISSLIDSMPTAAIVYGWSPEELKKNIDELKSKYKRFYSETGEKLIEPFKTSPRSLIKSIFSESSSNSNLRLLKRAFNFYETYSKLEHLGILSFGLTHRHYINNEQIKLTFDVYDSVHICITALNNYIHLWEDIHEKDFEILKEIENKIRDTHPSKIKYT